jgi:DNA-binding GntR family transcriptional regulator
VLSWGRANDAFHQTIHGAAGNEVLTATLVQLHRNFPRDLSRLVIGESTALLTTNVREHKSILDAIAGGNSTAARKRMFDHVCRAGNLVTLRVEQRAAAASNGA